MVTVKICGLRSREGVEAAAQAGADFGGFIFVPGRRRTVSPARVRELAPHLGATTPVGVFLNARTETVSRTAQEAGVKMVQLHGEESPSEGEYLAKSGLRIVRALSVKSLLTESDFEGWRDFVESFLLDAPRPGEGEGLPSSYLPPGDDPLQAITGRPTWLAGGLSPESVGGHPHLSRFDGVDVASGIEEDGEPSPERIRAFVAAAQNVR